MEPEQQAIARLKRGDIQGLESLVHGYYYKAVRAAYLVVDDEALAEDIVQAKFVQLATNIVRFEVGRPFGPWFLRSVINAAINAAKSRTRLTSFEEAEGDPETLLNKAFAAVSPGPEAAIEADELRQAIWAALQRLSPNQRAVIVLRYYLELSEFEMIQEMAAPGSSIKWWLHTARQRLRELLAAVEPGRTAEQAKLKSSPRRLEDGE